MDEQWKTPRPITEINSEHWQPPETEQQSAQGKRADNLSTPTKELHSITFSKNADDPIAELQTAVFQVTRANRRIKALRKEEAELCNILAAELETEKKTNSKLLYCNQQLSQELCELKKASEQIKAELDSTQEKRDQMLKELNANQALAHKARSDNHQLQRKLMEYEEINNSLRRESMSHKQRIAHTTKTINAFKNIMDQLEQNNQPIERQQEYIAESSKESFESWLSKKQLEEVEA